MQIGYFSRKDSGERLSLIPETPGESSVILTYFPELKQTSRGTVSMPYSLSSYRRIVSVFGDKFSTTEKCSLPFERLRARDRLEAIQRETCEIAHKEHISGFMESGFSPSFPRELPDGFDSNVKLMSHQVTSINYIIDSMADRKGFALYFDMGLGKTFTVLALIEYLIEIGEIRNALVICPLGTMWSSWADDVSSKTNMRSNVLYSAKTSTKKECEMRDVILKRFAHIYITNFETFRIDKYREMIAEAYDIDCVIVDESSRIKSHKSQSFKAIYDFVNDKDIEWRFCLSGTPAPKGVTDLWSQFMFLDNGIALGESWKQFEEEYTQLLPNSKFIRVPRRSAYREVHEKISPYMVVFKKEDVLDLPPRTHILKMVEMDASSRYMYDKLEEDGILAINDGLEIVEASNILTKFQKLRQLTGGFLYHENKTPGQGPLRCPSEKNEVAIGIVESILGQNEEDKVIIWGSFVYEMDRLCDILSEKKIKHVRAFGGIGPKNTLASIDSFRNNDTIRVIVASRASIGTGVNLQVANYAIYYSLDEDLEKYQQSLDRIYRIGQEKKVICYYLIARGTYDERLVTLLRKKQTMQDFLTQGEKITREKLRNPNLLTEWRIED